MQHDAEGKESLVGLAQPTPRSAREEGEIGKQLNSKHIWQTAGSLHDSETHCNIIKILRHLASMLPTVGYLSH